MLLALSTRIPTFATPAPTNITHTLHFLSPISHQEFTSSTPLPSPTSDNQERKLIPPRGEFDLAVANLVVHHVDDLKGFMQGVRGMLKPGGRVVFTEFGKLEGGKDVAGEHRIKLGEAKASQCNGP
jgi:SAM-dependent methyltransferase